MPHPFRLVPRLVVVGAALVPLTAVAPAVAVPPLVSGADSDLWRTDPTYTVSIGGPATTARNVYKWEASSGASGTSDVAPFTVTLATPQFPEGPGTFSVTQRPRQIFARAETTTRAFTVDRTAPAAVTLSIPPTNTAGTVTPVSWSAGEPGARYALRVQRDGGGVVQGPVDTASTSAHVVPLEPGAFVVSVVQIDPAGNVSPEASARRTIPDAVVPAFVPPVVAVVGGPTPRKLAAVNSTRLTPKAATRFASRRPVLRWVRGPSGTRLYNLQIFRGYPRRRTATGAPPVLRKGSSTFPKGRRKRTPLLARGVCYVWRIWPYRGSDFTPKPLGLSNFCVTAPPAAS